MEEKRKPKDEYVIVLDFLLNGYPFDPTPMHKKNPIIQGVGVQTFALLELVAKKEAFVQPYEEVYIGDGKRDKVHHIVGKLPSDKLTPTAKAELENVIKVVVEKDEKRFVDFFNKAQPLSTRMHSLELIPGLGKKHMWEIIEARKDKPFANFEDIRNRVKLMPDPQKAIVKRILKELLGDEKHRIFVENMELRQNA